MNLCGGHVWLTTGGTVDGQNSKCEDGYLPRAVHDMSQVASADLNLRTGRVM